MRNLISALRQFSATQVGATESWGSGCGAFAATHPEGYGVGYVVTKTHALVEVESRLSCADTCSSKFAEAVGGALEDIMALCRAAGGEGSSARL